MTAFFWLCVLRGVTEYHLWITIKKSGVPCNSDDKSEGYGLFAERKFYEGDIISIYLGEYVKDVPINDYALDQILVGGEKRRLQVAGGFPAYKVMYLGAHMANDSNWELKKNINPYNVSFNPTLGLEVIAEIKKGDELFVDYNYD